MTEIFTENLIECLCKMYVFI